MGFLIPTMPFQSFHFGVRTYILLLVPLTTVIFGRSILPSHNGMSPIWDPNESADMPIYTPNYTSSQFLSRIRRDDDSTNTTSDPSISDPITGVTSLFGVSFEYDTEKRNVEFHNGGVSILEGSTVTVRLFGVFAQGNRLKISKNHFSCDADTAEINVRNVFIQSST